MTTMTSNEKAELLKTTITHLYSKEGRSISYISRLLNINRTTIGRKIREWDLKPAEPRRHLTPSNQKFLNKNRNLIKSRLDHDAPLQKIAAELKISRDTLYRTFIQYDDVLKKAYDDLNRRRKEQAKRNRQAHKNSSRLNYDPSDLPGEHWTEILGYPGYYISDKGRAKHYVKKYKSYVLLAQTPNKDAGRPYVHLIDADGKPKNLMVARLVGHAFVPGFDETHNTINHEDGDVTNSDAKNLTWQSQSENNVHAYRKLNRNKVYKKRYRFDYILYQDKYQFKTVAAFAKFLGKSETQTRRYLDEPEKHEIRLVQIKNRND